ncbi:MAG: hypothetical protein AABZ06_00355 [Bdellovibrionota bacterium]
MKFYLAIAVLSVAAVTESFAGWSVSGSTQYIKGAYLGDEESSLKLLNLGVRYTAESWSATASLPVVIEMDGGLGDLFFSGSYDLVEEFFWLPDISVTSQLKAPTAKDGLGTGQWDLATGLNFRKTAGPWLGFADLGYAFIGDTDAADFNNSITYGLGAGRFLCDGDCSFLLYYQGSGSILDGYPPARQLSLGINYRLSPSLLGTLIGSKGFNSSSQKYVLAAGVQFQI